MPKKRIWQILPLVLHPSLDVGQQAVLGAARLNYAFFERSMANEVFQASRWTKGNLLFPTVIEVSDKAVTRRKRSWFSQDEMSITISKVASVHIKTGMIWSNILIESSGGTDPISSHGHSKADAQRIKELVENAQAALVLQKPENQT